MMHMCDCKFCDWCGTEDADERSLRQRQLIETAEALEQGHDPEFPAESRREVAAVCQAVEAMQAAMATP